MPASLSLVWFEFTTGTKTFNTQEQFSKESEERATAKITKKTRQRIVLLTGCKTDLKTSTHVFGSCAHHSSDCLN